MRTNLISRGVRFTLLATALFGAAVLISAPKSPFTALDKAYYADANLVSFVRPGLVITILSAEIAPDGTIRTRFKLSDPRGLPLEREGVTTPGAVAVSFIAAYIPKGQTQYVAYTTRVQRSTITNVSATQASADAGGVYEKLAEGEYRYTFGTKAPAAIDRNATHAISIYGSRTLAEFDLGIQRDDDVLVFVPDGSKPVVTRDVVKTETCNKCHDPLALHGGNRQSVGGCVMCHQPQTIDPDTGNTVDLPVMIHKIHMGSSLPSVIAGKPYQIIGNANSVNDYSHVAIPGGAGNCATCHSEGGTPQSPAQANAWLKPSRAACGACHDNVNFATGENHVDLPQVSDSQCATCHTPQGELDFDASILGAHLTPRFSKTLPGTVFELLKVDNATAGNKPTLTFTLKDKAGKPFLPSDTLRLAVVLAGPTSDYSWYVSEDARTAQGSAASGTFTHTFQTALPADAKGTYSIGMEGYRNILLLPGTKKEVAVRDAGVNKVINFSVDNSALEVRRTVVSLALCNSCHQSLDLHGSNRNTIEMCVLCHNPNVTDVLRRPATAGAPQTVDFRTMIHRIHTGEENAREYTIFGNGSVLHDFTEVLYPGDRRNCSTCHVNGSEQLPLRENLLAVNDPRGLITSPGPATAACLGCHTTRAAASHALANTTSLGESCAACHGSNAEFSVSRVHAR